MTRTATCDLHDEDVVAVEADEASGPVEIAVLTTTATTASATMSAATANTIAYFR